MLKVKKNANFLKKCFSSVCQVLVQPGLSGHLYGSLAVDSGSSINADLLLDTSQQHIYALTNSRVRHISSACLSGFFFLFFFNALQRKLI